MYISELYVETFYQICSAFIQYGEDENFLEGFDESSMKEPPSLYTNAHIQDTYDQQEDDIHPSIAGFPSHYRKVRFSDNSELTFLPIKLAFCILIKPRPCTNVNLDFSITKPCRS